VLLIDAVNMDGSPGSVKLIDCDKIIETGLSTHNMSLKLAVKYLKENTNADIRMLGIQPEKIGFGDDISGHVKKSVDKVVEAFKNVCGEGI